MIHTHVRHRESVIERRTQYNLDKAEARAHILEGLVKAQDRIDDVIASGKASESKEHFEKVLQGLEVIKGISKFDFSEAQSKAIAERRLYQLSRLDVNKVQKEHDELQITIADLKDILDSRRRRLDILISELDELVDRHGDERRTHVDPMPLSMDREDLIEERAIVITLTNDNYIRHLPAESFRMQNRGGKGMKGVQTKNEDFPITLITCFSKDRLLIFTNRPATKKVNDVEVPYIEGRVYGLKAWETPQGSRTSRGSHIRNILGLKEDEIVVSIIPISKELIDYPADHLLAFATRKGIIKKSLLSVYIKINRNGKKAINLAADDELVTVREGTDEDNVVMVSSNGLACRFSLNIVRTQGRVSSGVRGLKLKEGSSLVGMILTNDVDTSVLTLSKQGMAKRTRIGSGKSIPMIRNGEPVLDAEGKPKNQTDGYRLAKNRGGFGVRTMNLNEGDLISRVHQIPDIDDQLFLLSGKGIVIRIAASQTKETSGRASKGTRVMELRSKDKSSFEDELIFSARMPSELADEILTEKVAISEEE
jgi:DNA gyrase subunit A